MKLSEMNTMQLADALVRIAGPLERIGKDEEMNEQMAEMGERFRSGKLTNIEKMARMVSACISALLQRHRADTMEILSALTGKSVVEIAAQPGMQTIREAKESLDEDLLSFFK